MENPYLLKMGLFGAAGHSPNHVALATRKVCQNDEFLDGLAPLTRLWPSHISAKPKSMARARIWLRFWPLNHGLRNSHSFGGRSRVGAGAVMRHDELIVNLVDHFMAATPNRKDRNFV
jgi:hypothetical protein